MPEIQETYFSPSQTFNRQKREHITDQRQTKSIIPRRWDTAPAPKDLSENGKCMGILLVYDPRMKLEEINQILSTIPADKRKKDDNRFVYVAQITNCAQLHTDHMKMSTRDFSWAGYRAAEQKNGCCQVIDLKDEHRDDRLLDRHIQSLFFDHTKEIGWYHIAQRMGLYMKQYPELARVMVKQAAYLSNKYGPDRG